MNTSFGKLLEKSIFKKCFFIFILASAVLGGVINARAVQTVSESNFLSYFVGILYTAMGVSALVGNKIMERWRYKRLERIIGIYSCFFIYDFMILFLWWVVSNIFSFSAKTQAVGSFIMDILAAFIVMSGYFHAKQIKYTSYSVQIGLKGKACRIAMLSDIHLGVFVGEKHIRQMVKKINQLQVDFVVICGDIIDVNNHILDNEEELNKISSVLRGIQAKDGVFAVLGNHDPKITNKKFVHFLELSNIQLLHNQVIHLPNLNLIGRTDASNNDRKPMEELEKEISRSVPSIVLDHNPAGISEANAYGADLVLSGHTHKGQFIPVTYFTKIANGKHYFYGYERFEKTQAIISSGVGFFQLPVRIGTSNEIVDIHLT